MLLKQTHFIISTKIVLMIAITCSLFFLVSFIQSVVLHKSTAKYRIKHLIWESSNTDCQNEHQQKRPKIVNDKSRNGRSQRNGQIIMEHYQGEKKTHDTAKKKNRTKINCKSFYYALWLGWDLDSYGVFVIAAFHPSIFGRKSNFLLGLYRYSLP